MPDGHEIVGAEWDFASRSIRVFVEGPDLPEVPVGCLIQSIVPTVTKSQAADGETDYHWDWNLNQQ